MMLLLPPEFPGVTGGVTGGAATTEALVAQPAPPKDPGGQGEDFGKSSPVGLVVLLLFLLAVVLLVRSMNKHLRRVPESFDEPKNTGTE